MRGYFGIGIDGASKVGNVGNLVRTAHSFGAAFAFAIDPAVNHGLGKSPVRDHADTAKSAYNIPFYIYDSATDIQMPEASRMVVVEMTDDAIDLPEFPHPTRAVYILGGERSSVSKATLSRADDIIKIPTKFSLNVATAGAIVMYDRMRTLGRFADRPLMPGQKPDPVPRHVHGNLYSRTERAKLAAKRETKAALKAAGESKEEEKS